jgi:hypothetical protein
VSVTNHRHPGGVVPAVFQAPEPRNHNFEGLLLAYIADDSAHARKTTPEVTR